MRDFLEKKLWGNPQISRLLQSRFTGPRLGMTFLVLNLVLGFTHFALYLAFTESTGTELAPRAGAVLFFWHTILLFGLLCLLVPIKIAGFIEGPRIDRSFDQVVSTGISPLKFYLGSWFVGFNYAALLLLLSLPYAGCMIAVCEVSTGLMVWGYCVLLAYSNVIIVVTLALSVFGREWLSTPIAIVLLILLGIFGLIPDRDWVPYYPTLFAELTPVRALWQHSEPWEAMGLGAWIAPEPFANPYFLSWQIPLEKLRWLLWTTVVAVGATLFCIGPVHTFRPGLNSFGSVILEGDSKKSRLRRLRGGLTRKVELAFFYENGPEWGRRWGSLVRSLLAGAALFAFWGMTLGVVYRGTPFAGDQRFYSDERMLVSLMLNCSVLAAWILAVGGSRHSVGERVRIGRWSLRHEAVVALLFGLWTLGLFACQHHALQAILDNAGPSAFSGALPGVRDAYFMHWWRFVPAVLIVLANIFLLSRLLSRLLASHLLVKLFTLGLGAGCILGPIALTEIARRNALPEVILRLVPLSPFVLVDQIRSIPWSMDERWSRFLTTQGWVGVILILGILFRRVRGMIKSGTPRAATVSSLALAAVLGLPGELRAQVGTSASGDDPDAPMVIEELHRGFAGRVFAPSVDFYTMVIHNRSDAPIRGTYWIEAYGEREGREYSWELSAGARKMFRWNAGNDTTRWYGRSSLNQVIFRTGSHEVASAELPVALPQRQQGAASIGEQWLLVGEIRRLPSKWTPTTPGASREFWHCPRRVLPFDSESYRGVDLICLTPVDFEEILPEQRLALYEHVRLGGSLLLSGHFDRELIRGLPIWGELLATDDRAPVVDHPHLQGIRFREESTAVSTPGDSGEIPVLSIRHVGAGSVGYLGLRLTQEPAPLFDTDPTLWSRLEAALPRTLGPVLVQPPHGGDRNTDRTSFLYPFAYFGLYTVVVSGLLFFYCRRHVARWKVWAIVLGAPLGFLALIPTIEHAVHRGSSHAEQVEVSYFRAGSSHGLVSSYLTIGSSGRQEHSIQIEAELPRALVTDRHIYRYSALSERFASARPIPIVEGPKLDVTLLPWATRHLYLFGTSTLDHAPSGSAIVDLKRGTVDFEVELPLLGDPGPGAVAHLYLVGVDDQYRTPMTVPLDGSASPTDDGFVRLEGTTPLGTDANRVARPAWRRSSGDQTLFERHGCTIIGKASATPTLLLVIDFDDDRWAGMKLASEDLSFRLTGYRRSWQSPWPTEVQGEQATVTFIRRFWVLEVPVELR